MTDNEHSSVVTLLRKVEERDRNMETALAMSLSHIQHDVERLVRSTNFDNSSQIAQKYSNFKVKFRM